MNFLDLDFQNLNEADIREEVIAPLLRELGYRSGTENDIIREQLLKYGRSHLGRKKSTDPILRGKADYICEIKNKTRWVIEAKPPQESISNMDVIEQAWSYANHSEVRAAYFCLCNGRYFSIHLTNKGPDVEPIFKCQYTELNDSINIIKNILSPLSIMRDYPDYEPDYGEPLSSGLRSFARLTKGLITFESNSLNLKPFMGLVMTITEGSVERTEDGIIEAYIETQVPFKQLQDLNEKLGLHCFSLITLDKYVSRDSLTPTKFFGSKGTILPGGQPVLDLLTWQEVPLPMDLTVTTETSAVGILDDKIFKGSFAARLIYKEVGMVVDLNGSFTAHIN